MTSGIICNPGDIVGLPFPFSDLTSRKRRPVLVLTEADFRGDFMGLAITSVLTENNAVIIENPDMKDGSLPKKSWIRYDKIFTLSTSTVVRRYGAINEDVFLEVVNSLCQHVGCNSPNI
ncbi:MAG: type II toxin-antitoxin system PemK/MazF family toxin [Desulfobacter postgatei]|jgi:mRNA interferase MazF|uniref:Growth inhibitor n=1 Tax=Desulfobacter postgatei 2ac9 TaxID=879212 RepID=I5B6I1_9BACT|nr:type II toxin-antitoxin system PemK/MazF family toxin [Desulfobacter postgatei]EIM65094.1 growth inhibitor [Desulfobacter postgatei 2ac9]MDD4274307.1 type II toxin-antitoxin system PemK/MazF family toxin [Desulfobacter postgatei]